MYTRKWLAILGIVVLCGLLSACGSSSRGEEQATEKQGIPWETSEPDVEKNNTNVRLAIGELKKHGSLAAMAKPIDINHAIASPADYYGQVIKAEGWVMSSEEVEPGNRISRELGTGACCIELGVEGQRRADFIMAFLPVHASQLPPSMNRTVTIYGYPVGIYNLPNGKELVLVGRLE